MKLLYPAAVGTVVAYIYLQRHYFFSHNPWKWFSDTEAETVKRLVVIRDMQIADTDCTYSSAALLEPPVLSENNKNTSGWKVDKQKLPKAYAKVMVAFAFAMEGLELDSKSEQDVLLIGLGGGVVQNFLSTLEKAKLKMTSIELDPIVRDVAKKWFGLKENDTHQVVIADGAQFAKREAEKGKKYRAILLDACNSTCPVEVFLQPEVVKNIARILNEDGVLAINVLTEPVKDTAKINDILKLYKTYFASCFYYYLDSQQVLICSHRPGWTLDEQREVFMKNLREIDKNARKSKGDVLYKLEDNLIHEV